MSAPYLAPAKRDLVFLDTETSHLLPETGEVLEVAAVRVAHDFRELGAFQRKTRMQFPDRADPEALRINRYDANEWAREAVPIRVALVDLAELIGESAETCIVVGHNIRFDWDFLREAFRREGFALPPMKYLIDTASMAWPLCVQGKIDKISLETLCTYFKVANVGAHRALHDVRRCMAVYRHLVGVAA